MRKPIRPFTALCQLSYLLVVCVPATALYAASALLALPFAAMSRCIGPIVNFVKEDK